MASIEKSIKEIRAGKKEGINYLYRKFKNLLFKIGRDYGLTIEDAEEIMHDTFLKITKEIHRFEYRSDSSFINWMITIHKNHIKEFFRKQGKYFDQVHTEDLENLEGFEENEVKELLNDNINEEPDNNEIVDRRKEIIKKEIENLCENERILLNSRAKGIPYKTIGQMIKVDYKKLRVDHYRLEKKLEKILSDKFKKMKLL